MGPANTPCIVDMEKVMPFTIILAFIFHSLLPIQADDSRSFWPMAIKEADRKFADGKRMFERNKYDVALKTFKQALSMNPVKPEIWAMLGLTQAEIGGRDDAIESYMRASAFASKDDTVRQNLAQLHKVLFEEDDVQEDEESHKSFSSLNKGNLESAKKTRPMPKKKSKPKLKPESKPESKPELNSLKSKAETINRKPKESQRPPVDSQRPKLQSAKNVEPSKSDYDSAIGRASNRITNRAHRSAADEFHDGSYDDIDDELVSTEEVISKAIELAEDEKMDEALILFQKAVDMEPQAGQLYENLGVTQMRMGLLDEARVSFETALKLIGTHSYGSLKENMSALEQWVEFRKKDPAAFEAKKWQKSSPSASMKDLDSDFEKSSSAEDYDAVEFPDDEDIMRATDDAISLAESGDVVGSLSMFEKAARLDPSKGNSWINLGVTQMRLGLLHAARVSFNKAKKTLKGMPFGSLNDNLDALSKHEEYARSNNHDFSDMYPEYTNPSSLPNTAQHTDYDDDADYANTDNYESTGNHEAEKITNEAIEMAEAGDIDASLGLFQKAVDASPRNGRMWENLGVTQMRVQLLEDAERSFKTARMYDKGLGNENLKALEDNFRMTGHRSKNRQVHSDVESDGIVNEQEGNSVDFILELSKPFGMALAEDASVDNVKKGGQFDKAGVCAGDVIESVGIIDIRDLDGFKEAVSSNRGKGIKKVVVTFSSRSRKQSLAPQEEEVSATCDDGIEIELVKVGDRVQIRDAGGSWAEGTVESVSDSTGNPIVAKKGWDIGYEWDECKKL